MLLIQRDLRLLKALEPPRQLILQLFVRVSDVRVAVGPLPAGQRVAKLLKTQLLIVQRSRRLLNLRLQ